MYQGKHSTQKPKKKAAVSYCKRRTALIVSVVLILTVAVGGTLAYFTDAEWSDGHFTIGKVLCSARVSDKGVYVTNDSTVPACIRVAVVANWGNNEGIYYKQPQVSSTGNDWTTGEDGFFYYEKAIDPNVTVNLPISIGEGCPDGYLLQVNVLAEAIQEGAANAAWGFTPSGG